MVNYSFICFLKVIKLKKLILIKDSMYLKLLFHLWGLSGAAKIAIYLSAPFRFWLRLDNYFFLADLATFQLISFPEYFFALEFQKSVRQIIYCYSNNFSIKCEKIKLLQEGQ